MTAAKSGRGGARPGSGPKFLPPEEKRSHVLYVRCTEAEVDAIDAVRGELSRVEYVLGAALRSARRAKAGAR